MKQLKYNTMTKQEFLAFSLPYEIKTIRRITSDDLPIFSIIALSYESINLCRIKPVDGQDYFVPIDIIMPILHPLSDCFKEIEHNGEKFVPIDYLWFMVIGTDSDWMSKEDFYELIESGYTKLYPFCVVQHLIEWHFDIANLIPKGEAIDVNILEINPYK